MRRVAVGWALRCGKGSAGGLSRGWGRAGGDAWSHCGRPVRVMGRSVIYAAGSTAFARLHTLRKIFGRVVRLASAAAWRAARHRLWGQRGVQGACHSIQAETEGCSHRFIAWDPRIRPQPPPLSDPARSGVRISRTRGGPQPRTRFSVNPLCNTHLFQSACGRVRGGRDGIFREVGS